MADVQVRAAEGCDADSNVLWDSIWDPLGGLADWGLAGADEIHNHGGLQAKAILETAVILALFTDKRVDPLHPLAWLAEGSDYRGYWGDGVDVRTDLGETELGSLLWLLERAPLTIKGVSAAIWAKQIASEALKPLQDQGAVVRIDVDAQALPLQSQLNLTVNLYGRDGAKLYDRKFDLVWNQVT